jgi:C-terminal processing protease CtpA/Prc
MGWANIRKATAIPWAMVFLLVLAPVASGAEQRLGFVTQVEGEGFFLNPIVTKILVTEVTKGSLAEAAGIKVGDQIVQVEGQNVIGKRATELRPFLKFNPGETRKFRLRHADGPEVDARITKPKT